MGQRLTVTALYALSHYEKITVNNAVMFYDGGLQGSGL
jgi:hypothetical protein